MSSYEDTMRAQSEAATRAMGALLGVQPPMNQLEKAKLKVALNPRDLLGQLQTKNTEIEALHRRIHILEGSNELPLAFYATAARCKTIVARVCADWSVFKTEMMSERRSKNIVIARHVAMWEILKHTALSLPQVGRSFRRDHTSVLHGRRRVDRMIAEGKYTPYTWPWHQEGEAINDATDS